MLNEDLVIQKLINLETDNKFLKEKVARMDTLEQNMNILMNGQDKMIKILERIDDERLAMNSKITELEKEHIEPLEQDMQAIKIKLSVA